MGYSIFPLKSPTEFWLGASFSLHLLRRWKPWLQLWCYSSQERENGPRACPSLQQPVPLPGQGKKHTAITVIAILSAVLRSAQKCSQHQPVTWMLSLRWFKQSSQPMHLQLSPLAFHVAVWLLPLTGPSCSHQNWWQWLDVVPDQAISC